MKEFVGSSSPTFGAPSYSGTHLMSVRGREGKEGGGRKEERREGVNAGGGKKRRE